MRLQLVPEFRFYPLCLDCCCRLSYDTPAGPKEVRTRSVALTVPAYVAADLVAAKAPAAAEALKASGWLGCWVGYREARFCCGRSSSGKSAGYPTKLTGPGLPVCQAPQPALAHTRVS